MYENLSRGFDWAGPSPSTGAAPPVLATVESFAATLGSLGPLAPGLGSNMSGSPSSKASCRIETTFHNGEVHHLGK